jgi:transposase
MKKRPSYTKEFKFEAVRLLERGDKSAADLARELGIRRNQLYKWQEQVSAKGRDEAFPGHGRQAGAAAELARLKREVARLEEENVILKKAAVYFAKELS